MMQRGIWYELAYNKTVQFRIDNFWSMLERIEFSSNNSMECDSY